MYTLRLSQAPTAREMCIRDSPYAVADAVRDKKCSVKVYPVDAIWYGVTYHEDKEPVKKSIGKLIAAGEYPDGLWKNS